MPDYSKVRIFEENSNRDLWNRKFHKSLGQGRPIKAKQEFSKKILTDIKITGRPPIYQVGHGRPIKAKLEFHKVKF